MPLNGAQLFGLRALDKALLADIDCLLARLIQRNQNQHRRSPWWRSLKKFHVEVSQLVCALNGQQRPETRQALEYRVGHWEENLVGRWYQHFSQLFAEGPFCLLGLVLMTCTATVCRTTGITAQWQEDEVLEREMGEVVLLDLERGRLADEFGNLLEGEELWGLDQGEVVPRAAVLAGTEDEEEEKDNEINVGDENSDGDERKEDHGHEKEDEDEDEETEDRQYDEL